MLDKIRWREGWHRTTSEEQGERSSWIQIQVWQGCRKSSSIEKWVESGRGSHGWARARSRILIRFIFSHRSIELGFWGTATSAAVGGDNDSLKAAFGINNKSCVRQRQRKRLGHRLLSSCAFPLGWHLPLSDWTGSLFFRSPLCFPRLEELFFSHPGWRLRCKIHLSNETTLHRYWISLSIVRSGWAVALIVERSHSWRQQIFSFCLGTLFRLP